MGIGNIGWTEFLVILAIALIFFGPRRLPGIAQAIGKSLREFQKALNEVKSEIAEASREMEERPGPVIRPPALAPPPETTKEAETTVTPQPPEEPAPSQSAGDNAASSDRTETSNADPSDPHLA
ncbi:MAG: twin-arginine translocase TatA/TatE family subunit [Gemmatimonadota bacterium]|nr:MAG: twin-arginine translocase TatA/TatE family subunit [Gemmatimonadota bacterium]